MPYLRTLIIGLLVATFPHCSKNKEPRDIAAELTNGSFKWISTELTFRPDNGVFNGPQDCEKDNTYTFLPNGEYTVDCGSTLCFDNEQDVSSNYSYDKASKQIYIDGNTYEFVSLENGILKYALHVTYNGTYQSILFVFQKK